MVSGRHLEYRYPREDLYPLTIYRGGRVSLYVSFIRDILLQELQSLGRSAPSPPRPPPREASWAEPRSCLSHVSSDCPTAQNKWQIRSQHSCWPCVIEVRNFSNITFRTDTCFCALGTLNMEGQQGRLRLTEVVRNHLGSKLVNTGK